MLLRFICISFLMMMSFINAYICTWCWVVLIPLLDYIVVKQHLDKLQNIQSERIVYTLGIFELINISILCLAQYGIIESLFAILNSAFISVLIVNALQEMQNDNLYCKWLFKINAHKYFDFCIDSHSMLIDTIYTYFKRNLILNYKRKALESQRNNFQINKSTNIFLNRLIQELVIYIGVILIIYIHIGFISMIRYVLLIITYNYIRLGFEYITRYGLNGSQWRCSQELSTELMSQSKIRDLNNPLLPYSLITCFILSHRMKSWDKIKENFKEDVILDDPQAQQFITSELQMVSLPFTIIIAIILTF